MSCSTSYSINRMGVLFVILCQNNIAECGECYTQLNMCQPSSLNFVVYMYSCMRISSLRFKLSSLNKKFTKLNDEARSNLNLHVI